jgi:hypothetical protein
MLRGLVCGRLESCAGTEVTYNAGVNAKRISSQPCPSSVLQLTLDLAGHQQRRGQAS